MKFLNPAAKPPSHKHYGANGIHGLLERGQSNFNVLPVNNYGLKLMDWELQSTIEAHSSFSLVIIHVGSHQDN